MPFGLKGFYKQKKDCSDRQSFLVSGTLSRGCEKNFIETRYFDSKPTATVQIIFHLQVLYFIVDADK